ncbi:MAG: hypothetical protein COA47_05855 [Robiginitomaculum sp.]|nr:MAG: hypothetical protein COA47_05855 [Robiginitomaculum sp.]
MGKGAFRPFFDPCNNADIDYLDLDMGDPTAQRIRTSVRTWINPTSQPVFVHSTSNFDGFGRVYRTGGLGNASNLDGAVFIRTEFDDRGQALWTGNPHASATALPNASQRTAFTYDPLGRVLSQTNADGSRSELAYLSSDLDFTMNQAEASPPRPTASWLILMR